ncbi:MAG: hypothetical protein Q7R30_15405 [Acidobacteriota bacterium]|nr:hypothetical protein [Acidobacteriota bacterium]
MAISIVRLGSPRRRGEGLRLGTVRRLAFITNSILPSLVLHAGGNMFVFLGEFGAGRSEWQATAAPLVWETGPDATFVVTVAAAIGLGAAVFWAYSGLAAAVRAETIGEGRLRS